MLMTPVTWTAHVVHASRMWRVPCCGDPYALRKRSHDIHRHLLHVGAMSSLFLSATSRQCCRQALPHVSHSADLLRRTLHAGRPSCTRLPLQPTVVHC